MVLYSLFLVLPKYGVINKRIKETTVNIVYLNIHKQMYKDEQQFPISCLGSLYP